MSTRRASPPPLKKKSGSCSGPNCWNTNQSPLSPRLLIPDPKVRSPQSSKLNREKMSNQRCGQPCSAKRDSYSGRGQGDEELIITRVTKGNDPLATYYNDVEATQEVIEVEDTDTEDDLSEVSMQSHGDISKAELKAVLQGLTDSHRATANHLSALSTMVTGMTEEQVDQTTASVATELGAVQGWQHITQSFDRAQIALVLAVGVRKVEEFEILKGKRAKNDVTPFLRLAKIFGSNTRTIQECNAGIKYRYTPQERGPQREPPRRLQTTLVEEPATESTTDTQRATDSSNDTEMT